jgi:acyl-coenzyme A synthetase/AMP-(fatty) acid ligase
MDALIVDEDLKEVPPGAKGELLMTGPQVTLGYLRDPEKTAAVFVVPPGKTGIYYRTGDRVRRPQNDGSMTYLGRLDHQIKVQGYRVELGEVEACLRKEAAIEGAVAVGWPLSPSGAEGIVAFVDHPDVDVSALRNRLKAKLPPYAVPREIHVLPELPLNVNGKVDRKVLLRILTEKT